MASRPRCGGKPPATSNSSRSKGYPRRQTSQPYLVQENLHCCYINQLCIEFALTSRYDQMHGTDRTARLQLDVTTSLSTGGGPVSCVQLSEGSFQVVYPFGLWPRFSGVVKVLCGYG